MSISRFGVAAAAMALPDVSGLKPKPSRIISVVVIFNFLFDAFIKIVLYAIKYTFFSTGCGTADEHTEHFAVTECDAAFRSVHRAFC